MKRLGVIGIIFIISYCAYYDLTTGTLPNVHSLSKDVVHSGFSTAQFEPFQQVIVEPGQTVLSIVEHLHEGPIPASIQEIVYDFKQLNQGTEPINIQIGERYLFPLYH